MERLPKLLDWPTITLLSTYAAAVILASVLGGLIPEWIRLTHLKMQLTISFVGGMMLGIAVFHMLPHAIAASGSIDQVMVGVMVGLIATFFLLRFSHFHQHGPADFGILAEEQRQRNSEQSDVEDEGVESTHLCSDHNHPGNCEHHHYEGSRSARWLAVLVGLGVHTLIDGVALASGVLHERGHHQAWLPGLGIFLAVFLHKPLDAISITSLMHPVTKPRDRLLVNIGFALMCPLGMFLLWLSAYIGGGTYQVLATWGLAFSAGVFLCISLSDLLPEMEFHSHSRWHLSIALLLGILAAWSMGLLEGHSHDLPAAPTINSTEP